MMRSFGPALALAATVAVGAACRESGPNPDNVLPFGFLDSPANGAAVARVTRVAGWALDDGRVSRVDVYVDGRFAGSSTPGVLRPDLGTAHPAYPDAARGGWELAVDLGEREGGRHILAQAVDDQGATRDIGTASVTVAGRP